MDANTQSVEFLSREIERLTRELDQTNSEKIQSAQYGIVLLEEKENLQQRCEELETLFENTRHELMLTREVCKIKLAFLTFSSICAIYVYIPKMGNFKLICPHCYSQALARFQTSHKVTAKSGIETEESLLTESAARETSLNSQILDLEADTKQLKLELERVIAERDQILNQVFYHYEIH